MIRAGFPRPALAREDGHANWSRTDGIVQEAPVERRVLAAPTSQIAERDPFDPRAEQVRALRTELLLRRESPDSADVVALLSPCAGEGRSLLAAELASAFARTGYPTLLVDADLRHPRQHQLFGVDEPQLGLAQAIQSGEPPLLRSVGGMPGLSLLTAGVVPGDPLDLLSSHCFMTMIDDWRRDFEFVVIDTSPVGLYSDGLAVAGRVGRVLTLSRARHTPFKEMQEMLRRLGATRSRILGAVISHF
jgi:receptor protein-tyrosine kinase